MKKKMFSYLAVLLFAAVLFAWLGRGIAANHMDSGDDAIDPQTLEIYKRSIKLMSKSSHGRFILSGEVVDQDGNRLKDVEVVVRMDTLVGIGWDTKSEYRQDVIKDGLFHIDVRPYRGVNLRFLKKGYYDTRKDFDFDMDVMSREDEEAIMAGKEVKIEEGVVRRNNIRIVLEKKGDITQLTEREYKLSFRRQDGVSSGHVADLDRDKWLELSRGRGARVLVSVDDLLDPEQLSPRCLYVLPTVNEDGHIVSIDKAQPHWHRPLMLPQELRLILNDPEGGLIVYEQKEGEQAFWSLKQAPEEGYQQELVLDADWLFRRAPMMTTKPDDGIYFYFKVDGRYGKGRIETPQFTEGNYALEVSIRLRVQMDGTCNLDTGRR